MQKPVQDEYSKALEILWLRELRRFCQEAVEAEDFAVRFGQLIGIYNCRRPDLLSAIVIAAEKGADKPLVSLGNFITNWDFVRFAYLFERLPKDPSLPDLAQIKEAIKSCRSLRNKYAHPTYDPFHQGASDAKLASVLEFTRACLPKVNNLNQFERGRIYEKLAILESILFLREPQDQVEEVPATISIADAYRLLSLRETKRS